MRNFFKHTIKSIRYETLKRVQGDKKWIAARSLVVKGTFWSTPESQIHTPCEL